MPVRQHEQRGSRAPVFIDGIGHSILTDYGTGIPDWSTARKFAAAFGVSGLRLSAVGGAVLSWHNTQTTGDGGWQFVAQRYSRSEKLTAPYMPKSQCVFVRYGINDLAQLGPGATNLAPFKEAFRAALSMMRQAARWEAETLPSSLAWGGTWNTNTGVTATNGYASGTGSRFVTSATGSPTMTWTLPTDWPAGWTATIGTIVGGTSDTRATWGVSINSVAQPDWVPSAGAKGYQSTAAASGRFTGAVLRLPNRSAGDVIVLTAKTVNAVGYIDYVAIEPPTNLGWAPIILAIMENRPVAAAYNSYNASPYYGYTSTLNGATSIGASTFSVATPLSMLGSGGTTPAIRVGDTITLEEGTANEENVTVQAVSGTGPWTVTPAAPTNPTVAITLAKAHSNAVAIRGGMQDYDLTGAAGINQQIKDVVAEFGDNMIRTVGLDTKDGGPFAKQSTWFFDNLHYNELGHQKAAETIYNTLNGMNIPLTVLSTANVPDRQTWLTMLSFSNGWVNYAATADTGEPWVQYVKDTFTNIVQLRGVVKSGTPYTNMFTMPAGYRPAIEITRTDGVYSLGGLARLTIGTNGDVACSLNCDPTYVGFSVSYLAEQ